MPKMAKWSDKPLGKITLVLKLLSCEAKAAPAEKKPKEKKKEEVRLSCWIVGGGGGGVGGVVSGVANSS